MSATSMKMTVNLVKSSLEKMTHSNHGFTNINAIQQFPCKLIPPATYEQPDKLLIKDMRNLKFKLRKMKREGLGNFKIVSDFDQTLTKSIHEGQKVQASFGLFRESPLISSETRKEIETIFKQFKDKERLEDSDKLVKAINMQKWVSISMEKILSETIKMEEVAKLLEKAFLIPRAKIDSLLQVCGRYEVPFYLISAGISNIIASVIRHYVDLEKYQDFHLYANEMIFSKEGYLTEFKKPYVHSYSKDDIFLKQGTYRKNILLLGDLLHDIHLAKNINPKVLITIGYMNYTTGYDVEKMIVDYARKYDIVIVTEGNLELPELITKYVIDIESEQTMFKHLDQNLLSMEDAKSYVCNIVKKHNLNFLS